MTLERVGRTIEEAGLIAKGDKVLVALSGGADSTALLLILSFLSKEKEFSVFAAHFNHGIRDEADGDESFCRSLCEKYGVPFFSKKEDVPLYAKENGLSLETAARKLRYEFLYEMKEKTGADAIATAHHADDSAESILMHILRGSGMAGLVGIRKKSVLRVMKEGGEKELTLIRPLINETKEELLAFLSEKGQEYRVDSTNYQDDAARNFLRLSVIPKIEERINPSVKNNLLRLGRIAEEDENYLYSAAKKSLENAKSGEGYDAKTLLSYERPILKRCLRLALQEKATLVDVEAVHIESLISLLSMQSGQLIHLPHSTVRVSFGKLIIERERAEREKGISLVYFPKKEGSYEAGVYSVRLDIFSVPPMEKEEDVEYNVRKYGGYEKGALIAVMDEAKLAGHLTVRSRLPGDRFRPINSDFNMKLKDLLISRKVDERKRDSLPLVVSDERIVFIPTVTVSDYAKVTKKTERILRMEFKRK